MNGLTRVLAAAAVALSLSVAALPANADPTPAPAPPQAQSSSSTTSRSFTVGGSNAEKMLRASRAVNKSKYHKKRHLDWRQVKKQFGKHTTWRDDFGAGYLGGGGKLDHAASSTKTRLKKRWQDMVRSGLRSGSAGRVGPGTNCTGVTKDVAYSRSRGYSEVWLNSCDTNFLLDKYGTATAVLAFLSARAKGWWSAIPGLFGTVLLIKTGDLAAAQKNSTVQAVIYRYTRVARVGGSGLVDGQVYISESLRSQ